MLGKFCVFCGQKPKGKNREHVIPLWLLEMTGKPTRSVILGFNWRKPEAGLRRFGYSSFTFPACERCNTEFSDLESRAKRVVTAMLASEPLAAADLDTLLDWLDKVRVGIWLGLTYLNNNMHYIRPMFYIRQRMGASDRLVFVYRDPEKMQGVMWAGADSPIFHVMPSCMSLTINSLHLFNASNNFLFAPRIGFPSQEMGKVRPDGSGEYLMRLNPATGRVELPLVPYPILPGGTEFYQPMIPRLAQTVKGDFRGRYDTAYIRGCCQDFAAGRGKVFHLKDGTLTQYPDAPTTDWQPPLVLVQRTLLHELPLQAMNWLEQMFTGQLPSLEGFDPERLETVRKDREASIEWHRRMVRSLEEINRNREPDKLLS